MGDGMSAKAATGIAALNERQRYRLETVNMVLKTMATRCGMSIFECSGMFARVVMGSNGNWHYIPANSLSPTVDLMGPVCGKGRGINGFGHDVEVMRFLRSLCAFVSHGKRVVLGTVFKALTHNHLDRSIAGTSRLIEVLLHEYRFAGVFERKKSGAFL